MRQAASLLLSCALLIAGLWLLYMQLFISPVIKGMFVKAAGLMIAGGGAWFFCDFVLPIFRKK